MNQKGAKADEPQQGRGTIASDSADPRHLTEQPVEVDPDPAKKSRGPRQVIEQAAADVEHGLVDTGRGIPNDVPASGAPEAGRETEVPARGVSRKHYSEAQTGKPGADEIEGRKPATD